MFTIDDKEYEIEYAQKRIELIETVIKKSVMEIFATNQALMTIKELKSFVAYGIKEIGATMYVNPAKGEKIAEKLLEAEGYPTLLSAVSEAIERDCGFFFRSA